MARTHRNSLSQLNRLLPEPITLEDHTPDRFHFDETSHITDVLVGEYHVIKGEGGHQYIVWSIKIIINNSSYSSLVIYKRYSELVTFRQKLVEAHKDVEIVALPPRDDMSVQRMLWSKAWLEARRKGLQWFMTNVVLNPRLQHAKEVIEFVLR